ncbi:MAG: RsbRD N-terminal domain-containing protein [Deltaproteobacteria bacterium]|nr:RsbRD N-terminal domain-containing protein [Deltaproteobacteria bacterium]MBW2216058.1 RsbRD N-terminal domain-containing protein [Deltaproteobacteria bacterium]
MSLDKLIFEKRSTFIKKWRNLIIGSYPTDGQRFLKKEKNRFSNPVGQTIAEDVEILFDALTTGDNTEKIPSSLDNMIRIRAVQDFKPSQAVGFVLQLKKIIHEELEKNHQGIETLHDELEVIEERIEDAALQAFDIYTQCRQKLYEIRVNETQRQVARILERVNLTNEIPESDPDH